MSTTRPTRRLGEPPARAKVVRALANADPHARCWRCGELARAWDPWVAGRTSDGQLMAEHRSCCSSAGAKRLHQQRQGVEAGPATMAEPLAQLPAPVESEAARSRDDTFAVPASR